MTTLTQFKEPRWWQYKLTCPRHSEETYQDRFQAWRCRACEWHRLPTLRPDAERDRLIKDNVGLAYQVVGDYVSAYPWLRRKKDDLESYAMLTLLRAAERWDGSTQFSTFATNCIEKAIRNVSTSPNRKQNDIIWELTKLVGHWGEPSEKAGRCGATVNRLDPYRKQALQNFKADQDTDNTPQADLFKIHSMLKAMPATMRTRRLAVELTVIGDMSLQEAAKVMKVTRARVGQLRAECIIWLRKHIQGGLDNGRTNETL